MSNLPSLTDPAQRIPVVMPLLYWRLLLGFLAELDDSFSCAGCNDFPLVITPDVAPALEQLFRQTASPADDPVSEEDLQRRWAAALTRGRMYFHDSALLDALESAITAQVPTTPLHR